MVSKFKLRAKSKESMIAYFLLLPFIGFYLLFTFYPLMQGFFISFYEWNITSDKVFIGLDNYKELFAEDAFWQALRHTFLYVVFSTPIFMFGAFLFAVIIDHKLIKGKALLRGVFFLPNVLAVSIVSIVWISIYQPYGGLLNNVLSLFGIEGSLAWLNDKNLVWPAITGLTFWWNTGYYMILYLAGLQEIPEDRYEAAQIDGANAWHTLRYITLPSLKRIHVLVLFLQAVASFKIFGQVFLTSEGGPGGASRTYIQYIYESGFQRFLMGKASAAAFVLFLVIMLVSMLQLRLLKNVNED